MSRGRYTGRDGDVGQEPRATPAAAPDVPPVETSSPVGSQPTLPSGALDEPVAVEVTCCPLCVAYSDGRPDVRNGLLKLCPACDELRANLLDGARDAAAAARAMPASSTAGVMARAALLDAAAHATLAIVALNRVG